MIPLNFSRLSPKLHKNRVIIVLGLVIIVISFISSYSQHSIPPFPIPSSLSNASPSASVSELIPLNVVDYSPRGLNPAIANTNTAVYLKFNRSLTDFEIDNLTLTSKPAVSFRKISHINRQILYFTSNELWKDQILYTLTLSFPQSPDLKTFYFSPSSLVNQDNVINSTENLPKP